MTTASQNARRLERLRARRGPCQYCRQRVASMGRRLCSVCRLDPEARERCRRPERWCERCQMMRLSDNPRIAANGLCNNCRKGREVPPRILAANALVAVVGVGPTDAPAYSPERLAVLINREAAGLPLWNPRDRIGERDERCVVVLESEPEDEGDEP